VTAYADSGVVAKALRARAEQPRGGASRVLLRTPLPLTHLQALEVRNALRLKAFRGEMTRTQLRRTLSRLADDIRSGRWQLPRYALTDV